MEESLIFQCPRCGANNRVPKARLAGAKSPVCGQCKSPLPLTAYPVTVTDASFPSEVERSPLPVLLDMWAPWCGPCQTIAPALEQIATEMAGRVKVAKLNVDENPVTSNRFQIRSIPCLMVLDSGREIDRMVGAQPKSEILRRLAQLLPAAF